MAVLDSTGLIEVSYPVFSQDDDQVGTAVGGVLVDGFHSKTVLDYINGQVLNGKVATPVYDMGVST